MKQNSCNQDFSKSYRQPLQAKLYTASKAAKQKFLLKKKEEEEEEEEQRTIMAL